MANTEWAHAIDVSSHNPPASVPYAELAANGVRSVWIRAAYGTRLDTAAVEHSKRARGVGIEPSVYLFWRILEDDLAQLEALERQMDACGIGPGSPAPWLDVEDDRDRKGNIVAPVSRAWLPRVNDVMGALAARYGAACLYAYEYSLDCILHWPAWPTVVAHYRGEGEQRWPPCTITAPAGADVVGHQYGVGPGVSYRGVQQSTGAGVLDRDWMRWPPLRVAARQDAICEVEMTPEEIARLAVVGMMEGMQR